jgi:hypothetical protein
MCLPTSPSIGRDCGVAPMGRLLAQRQMSSFRQTSGFETTSTRRQMSSTLFSPFSFLPPQALPPSFLAAPLAAVAGWTGPLTQPKAAPPGGSAAESKACLATGHRWV